MSFSQNVKSELCQIRPAGCCKYAECYGMLLFGRSFCENNISLLTGSRDAANRLVTLLKLCFDAVATVSEGGVKSPTFLVTLDSEIDIKRILIKYNRIGSSAVSGIDRSFFVKECCTEAFIRGAFLACGSISDPQKTFQAEFAIKNPKIAEDFYSVLYERGLFPHIAYRNGKKVIFFKNGGEIEDLLTAMNATNHSLLLMNEQILKDVRNRTNRIKNCDNANISKTIEASIAVRNAIDKLKSNGKLEALPPELYEVAQLRIKYPEESLSQLCELAGNKLTRSGMNHRLKKIIEFSKE